MIQSFYKAIMQLVEAGLGLHEIERELLALVQDFELFLQKHCKKVETVDDVRNIATISSNYDKNIASAFVDFYEKIGGHYLMTLENADNYETTYTIVNGYQINRSYLNHFFITHPDRQVCHLTRPLLLLSLEPMLLLDEIMPFLRQVEKLKRPLVVIAPDFSEQVLATMVLNKTKDILTAVPIKCPEVGKNRQNIMEDLAVLTDTFVFSRERDLPLPQQGQTSLPSTYKFGECETILIDPMHTNFISGAGDRELMNQRIKLLEKEIELDGNFLPPDELKMLETRLSRLRGGAVKVKVGAKSEAEQEEKKARYDDTYFAIKAALDGGYVVGGACIYAKYIAKSQDVREPIKSALLAPLKKLITNASIGISVDNSEKTSNIIQDVLESELDMGYNVLTDKTENLVEAGVIDPVNVIVANLKTAIETAFLLARADGIITNFTAIE